MKSIDEDLKWLREHLVDDILPNWLKHAQTENGLFFPHFGRTWEKLDRDVCTLVSQGRLLYNFSVGHRITEKTEYLDAVNQGADALLRCFKDQKHGGWFYSCNLRGEVLDSQKDLYGHDFVIFGLAHASIVTDREDLKEEALNTCEFVHTHFREEQGGYLWKLERELKPIPQTRSQNPIMHLFEALSALDTLDDSGYVRKSGEEVAGFVLDHLIRKRDGVLPEVYDAGWRELSAENGGRIDVGHQFEWSYLLSHAAESGWPQGYLEPAERLLENGLKLGFDKTDGGIISPTKPDGTVTTPVKGWWEQCEAIRALLHFGIVRGHEEAWEPLEKTITFARRNFVDEEYGGWYSQPFTYDELPSSLDKGSEWKVDYHVVGACSEALRLQRIFSK